MKLTELLAQLKSLDEKIDALPAEGLTEEQAAEQARLFDERKKVADQVRREQARLAREQETARLQLEAAEAADRQAEIGRLRQQAEEKKSRQLPPTRPLTDPDPPRAADVPGERGRISIPARYKRAGHLKNFRGVRNGLDAEQRAFRFGQWALAQLTLQLPSRYAFAEAVDFTKKNIAVVTSKDASGYQNLIPEEFSSDLIDLREQYGVARRLLRMETMKGDTKFVPRRQGGLTAYFVGEGQAGTESNKVWDKVRLTARKLMVLSRTSNEVDDDLAISWGDDLAGEIAYAFALKEDQCAFLGDATSTYGGIQGVLTKLQDVDGSGTDSAGLVTGTGNAYSELTMPDFEAVVGKLPQYADTPDACWVCHRTFYYTVMLRLELALGGATATEAREGDRRPRPMFLGYPVEFSQVYPSTEANSQACVSLGDHSLGAMFGDRGMEEVEFSDQATVNSESLWERDELGIRGKQRFDINVHDVGDASTPGPIVGLQTAAS